MGDALERIPPRHRKRKNPTPNVTFPSHPPLDIGRAICFHRRPMAIPLEDKFNDIVGKAMRGFKLSDSEVAEKAGVSAAEVQTLRDGQWNEAVARQVAPVLALKAEALAASGNESWQPKPVKLDGFASFNTPYEDM